MKLFIALFFALFPLATCIQPNAIHTRQDGLTALLQQFPRIALTNLPTPLIPLENLSARCNRSLYLKRDDQTGVLDQQKTRAFGGNKVRKLEFLLADARIRGAKEIITLGCIGSNHVAATATYCRQLGLPCHAYLLPQPITSTVLQTLSYTIKQGAVIHYFNSRELRDTAADNYCAGHQNTYLIPTGGSTPLGCIGYIAAALELYEQMQTNHLSFDAIYLAGGSFGTAVGLWIGLSALGLTIPLKVTHVNDKPHERALSELYQLAHDTVTFLQQHDPSFDPHLDAGIIELVEGYCGSEYGAVTWQARAAQRIMQDTESIVLDHTYTAKCFAHLMHDIENKSVGNNTGILFWNTYCCITNAPYIK